MGLAPLNPLKTLLKRIPFWFVLRVVDVEPLRAGRYCLKSVAGLLLSRPTSAVNLGDSMVVSRNHRAMKAGMMPTPTTQRQTSFKFFRHWSLQLVGVESDGMPCLCLTTAIKATTVEAI